MPVFRFRALRVLAPTETTEQYSSCGSEAGEYDVANERARARAEESVAVFVFAALGAVEVVGLVMVAPMSMARRVVAVGIRV